jgi:hypothetical protein
MDYNKSDTGIDDSQVTSKMVKMHNWIFVRTTNRCMFDSSCLLKIFYSLRPILPFADTSDTFVFVEGNIIVIRELVELVYLQ